MVTEEDIVKILDFGLAKLIELEPAELDATQTIAKGVGPLTEEGAVLGTAAYMSPEQATGKPVDGRSDIFSFGCVLHEMLSGRRAFDRSSRIETLAAIVRDSQPR